jgi:hypothetical protein
MGKARKLGFVFKINRAALALEHIKVLNFSVNRTLSSFLIKIRFSFLLFSSLITPRVEFSNILKSSRI